MRNQKEVLVMKSVSTSVWKNFNLSGHIQLTKGRPTNFERKQQDEAPDVAEKTIRTIPFATPKSAPASNDKNMVPGIMNVCMKMQTEQYPNINLAW